MNTIIRQLIEDNDDGDATHGRIDDMTPRDAANDLSLSIMLLNPTETQRLAFAQDIQSALNGSEAEIRHDIEGHVVTADNGRTGHDNEFSIHVDDICILRVDVNFIDRRMAA